MISIFFPFGISRPLPFLIYVRNVHDVHHVHDVRQAKAFYICCISRSALGKKERPGNEPTGGSSIYTRSRVGIHSPSCPDAVQAKKSAGYCQPCAPPGDTRRHGHPGFRSQGPRLLRHAHLPCLHGTGSKVPRERPLIHIGHDRDGVPPPGVPTVSRHPSVVPRCQESKIQRQMPEREWHHLNCRDRKSHSRRASGSSSGTLAIEAGKPPRSSPTL